MILDQAIQNLDAAKKEKTFTVISQVEPEGTKTKHKDVIRRMKQQKFLIDIVGKWCHCGIDSDRYE